MSEVKGNCLKAASPKGEGFQTPQEDNKKSIGGCYGSRT